MKFIPMDPELARKAIEGYSNVLRPEIEQLEAFYRQFRCLRCRSACQKEQAAGHVFDPTGGILVPRSLLRCTVCRFLFDPHTGLVVEVGEKREPPPL